MGDTLSRDGHISHVTYPHRVWRVMDDKSSVCLQQRREAHHKSGNAPMTTLSDVAGFLAPREEALVVVHV